MSFDEDEKEFKDRYSDKYFGEEDSHDVNNGDKKSRGSGDDFFKDEDFEFESYEGKDIESEGFRSKRIKQRRKRRKVIFRIIAVLFVLVVVAAGAVFGYRYIKNKFFAAAEGITEEERINIPSSLELGQDINMVIACAGENLLEPELSSIMFSSYYSSEEKLISLCIPVNTYVDIPGTGAGLVSESVGIGGMDLLSLSLENILGMGMKVDYYILLDVYNVVNKLEGVELELDEEITVKNYDDGSTFKLEKGKNLIDGAEAVNFLKYFSGIEKDVPVGDIVKQKILLDAIINKIVGDSEEKLSANLNAVKDFMSTDLNMEDRLKIFSTFSNVEADKNLSYALGISSSPDLEGIGIVRIPDVSGIAELFNKEGAAPEEETTDFTDTVKITILNGVYNSPEAFGLAGTTSKTFEGLEFEDGRNKYEIVRVENADSGDNESTQILVYSPDENSLAAADDIKGVLGVGSISTVEEEIDSDIVIVLGKDYLNVIATSQEGEVEEQLTKIIVINGEGTAKLAATVTDILEDYFNTEEKVVELSEPRSADNFNYTQTEIVIFTSREGVNEIAQQIQERLGVGVIEYSDNNVDNVDIGVILGSDYTNQ